MKLGRKITSGKYKKQKKRKKYEKGRDIRVVNIGKNKTKKIKGRGSTKKTVLLSTEIANIYNKKEKESKKVKIKNVLETPQNRFWARQNRLAKGSIIETEIGKAKITNRPSQEGSVQAVLIEDSE